MRRFNRHHGTELAECGISMVRVPCPVFMQLQARPFEVETSSGVLKGEPGDYVCYDPLNDMVGLVPSDEVGKFYELAEHYLPTFIHQEPS